MSKYFSSKQLALSGCFAVVLLGGTLVATQVMAARTAASDFVHNATIGGQFEISSSRLALQNSQNDDVKAFARQMIDDHSQIGDQLKSVISLSNAELSEPVNVLDPKHQKMLGKLEKLSGADFDRKYVNEQVAAHKEAVKLFADYARHGDNPALKNFAAQNLPTIEGHLRHIETMQPSF